MKMPELARALGVSLNQAYRCRRRGMPITSVEAAVAWREQHLDPLRRLGGRIDRPAPEPAETWRLDEILAMGTRLIGDVRAGKATLEDVVSLIYVATATLTPSDQATALNLVQRFRNFHASVEQTPQTPRTPQREHTNTPTPGESRESGESNSANPVNFAANETDY